VNLILFGQEETLHPLPRVDRRALHILEVLKRQPGDSFDAGLVNGPRGKATIRGITNDHLSLEFRWDGPPPAADPITLIVGLPRPQTARDILRDATTLGVAAIHFVTTEKSDASYGQSSLWTTGEWRRHLIAGAEQAYDTRIPAVTYGQRLQRSLESLPAGTGRIALDVYESPHPLGHVTVRPGDPVILAIGGERGWSAADRDVLRAHQFSLHNMGARVLRTESAIIAALSILRGKLGLM
jgi:16S rRNA (uracil1498-N3)-methyltransferase